MEETTVVQSKKRKRPSKSYFVWGMIGISIFVIVFVIFITRQDDLTKVDTADVKKGVKSMPGGPGTPQYNDLLTEHIHDKADEAERSGKSYFSPVIGQQVKNNSEEKTTVKKQIDEGVTETVQPRPRRKTSLEVRNTRQEPRTDYMSAIKDGLSMVAAKRTLKPQRVFVYSVPEEKQEETGQGSAASMTAEQSNKTAAPFKPGDVFYAVNEVAVNSDASGSPVACTVVSGDLKGSRVLGGFSRQGEYLILKFTQLVNGDEVYSLTGYAVDPTTSAAAVRSDVDTHFWARWGGLMAASFLSGLGDAFATSGSETATTIGTGGTSSIVSAPTYNLTDKLIIGFGEVGDKLADQFEKNFNMPPTVTLNAGQPLGILVMAAG